MPHILSQSTQKQILARVGNDVVGVERPIVEYSGEIVPGGPAVSSLSFSNLDVGFDGRGCDYILEGYFSSVSGGNPPLGTHTYYYLNPNGDASNQSSEGIGSYWGAGWSAMGAVPRARMTIGWIPAGQFISKITAHLFFKTPNVDRSVLSECVTGDGSGGLSTGLFGGRYTTGSSTVITSFTITTNQPVAAIGEASWFKLFRVS